MFFFEFIPLACLLIIVNRSLGILGLIFWWVIVLGLVESCALDIVLFTTQGDLANNSSWADTNSSADDLSGWANADAEWHSGDSKPKQSLVGILGAGAARIVLVAGLTFGHGHHGHKHHGDVELSGLGLWINAMGCSLLVSLASLICLVLLPLIFIQGKPSKAVVDSLALFGVGAMLGDAFLHQLPHAFGGEHSHSHDHQNGHDHHAHSGQSHSHSLNDLSIGLSILAGFLIVEKLVRYVEEFSGGENSWSLGHHHHHHRHHHHHKHTNKLKDDDDHTHENDHDEKNEKSSKKASEEKESSKPSDTSRSAKTSKKDSLRKTAQVTLVFRGSVFSL